MKTLSSKIITPVFCEDDVPQNPYKDYEPDKIYINKDRTTIALNCLCGCGAFIMLPVNQKPEGWALQVHEDKSITLHGSIRQGGCNAHYVINKNKVNFLP